MDGILDIKELKELVKLKREKPEEYKQLLMDMFEIVKDLQKDPTLGDN